MPFKTTPKLLESSVLNLFNIYMIPINKLGYLMDCDLYGIKERAMLSKMIKSINKTIIVKGNVGLGGKNPSNPSVKLFVSNSDSLEVSSIFVVDSFLSYL